MEVRGWVVSDNLQPFFFSLWIMTKVGLLVPLYLFLFGVLFSGSAAQEKKKSQG